MEFLYINGVVDITEEPQRSCEAKPITIHSTINNSTFPGTLEWRNFKPFVRGYNASTGDYHVYESKARNLPSVRTIVNTFLADKSAYLVDPNSFDSQQPSYFLEHHVPVYDMSKRYRLLKGEPQSQKSIVIICQALTNYFNGLSSVIVVLNFYGQRTQLESRLDSLIQECMVQIKEHYPNHNEEPVFSFDPNVLSAHKPAIVIALSNIVQIRNVTRNILDKNLSGKVSLLIDEVDAVDTEKETTQVAQKLNQLKSHMHSVYGISATVMDTIFKEKLSSTNITILAKPLHYKGVEAVEFKNLPLPVNKKEPDLLKRDPNLLPFMDKFVKFAPVHDSVFDDTHPIMYLMRVFHKIADMEALQEYCRVKYPQITTIVYNYNGITLCSEKLNSPTITMTQARNQLIVKRSGHLYTTKDVSISGVISYLKDNGGVKTFTHILVIADNLASRGMTFMSSDFAICMRNKQMGWHLLGQYFSDLIAKRKSNPDAMQAARVFGVIKDNIPLRWYGSESTNLAVKQAFGNQDQLIKGGMLNTNITLDESIKLVPISKEKVSKKHKLTKIQKPPKLNIVNGPDGSDNQYWINVGVIRADNYPEQHSSNGKFFLIRRDTLGKVSQGYYLRIVRAFDPTFERGEDKDNENALGTGVWRSKGEVLRSITRTDKQYDLIRSTTHPWHDARKGDKHYRLVDSEEHPGLLFRQENSGDEWSVRFNV